MLDCSRKFCKIIAIVRRKYVFKRVNEKSQVKGEKMIKITKTVWFLSVVLVVVGFHVGAGAEDSAAAEKAAEEEPKFEKDIIKTKSGTLEISFIGHGTLMFKFNDKIIYTDPVSRYTNEAEMPKGDLILVTHEHSDHLDARAIEVVRKENTKIVLTKACTEKAGGGVVMKNGDVKTVLGLKIEAVAAYNILHKRSNGEPFHPKGRGNGYIITFDDKRVYVAGDTENTPEMKKLKNIDIAFLPMNLPYTMTPEMVADAAKAFKPKVLYPYHYGQTDPAKLVDLLKDSKEIKVRIRKMR
jgi:L-ascorbate metabolism protein UlaG (beta-lactamase superfamily)